MTNHEKYKQAFDCLTTDAEINLNPPTPHPPPAAAGQPVWFGACATLLHVWS